MALRFAPGALSLKDMALCFAPYALRLKDSKSHIKLNGARFPGVNAAD